MGKVREYTIRYLYFSCKDQMWCVGECTVASDSLANAKSKVSKKAKKAGRITSDMWEIESK